MELLGPPGIQTGQPLTYYQHLCTRLHDSSFPGHEIHIGMIELGNSTRVIHVHMKDGVATALTLLTVEGDTLEGVSLSSSPTVITQALQEKGHHSSLFDDMIVFDDALAVLHFDDDGSPSFMEWYDPNYWDSASFIEETFPQSSPKQP
ncbi:hypothetical protein [Actinomyces massiliensis]|uniref:hypothetical protein n=1 Tax=Actinomyces massiliensis TaxID=461393 RepID=UPI0028E38EBF|nr:hypothetical protein [Actinomyces massiliensis]